eukprot:gene10867-16985_t
MQAPDADVGLGLKRTGGSRVAPEMAPLFANIFFFLSATMALSTLARANRPTFSAVRCTAPRSVRVLAVRPQASKDAKVDMVQGACALAV